MATKDIVITIRADDKGTAEVKRSFDKIKKQAESAHMKIGESAKKSSLDVGKIAKSYLGVTAAITTFVMVVKKSTEAYMKQERAEMKLAVAMKNTGDFTRGNFNAMKEYAKQMQKVSTYGDEVVLTTMANLKSYGMNTEELKKATKATMDLATAKGLDLRAASELVGKAFVGETGTLSRYGIVLEKGIEKSQKFDAVLGLINNRFGGAAQADINTYAGQLKQLSNWWGDVAEKVGYFLIKALEAAQTALGYFLTYFYKGWALMIKPLEKFFELLTKIPVVGKQFEGFRDTLEGVGMAFKNAGEKSSAFAKKSWELYKAEDRVSDAINKQIEQERERGKALDTTGDKAENLSKKWLTLENELNKKLDKLTLNEYDFRYKQLMASYNDKLNVINKEVKDYKKSIEAKKLLDKWYTKEKEKISDDWLKNELENYKKEEREKENLSKKEKASYEYQMRQTTNYHDYVKYRRAIETNEWMTDQERQIVAFEKKWDRMLEIVTNISGNMQNVMSDVLFDFFTNEMKSIEDYWESLWRSMLRTATDMAAKIAVEAASGLAIDLIAGFFASGKWKLEDDQIAVVHKGEMIVPEKIAEKIRSTHKDWNEMTSHYNALPGGLKDTFTTGMAGRYASLVQSHAIAQAVGSISGPGLSASGLLSLTTNPNLLGLSLVRGVSNAMTESMGLTSNMAQKGQKWGGLFGLLGGAFGLGISGPAGAMVTAGLGEVIGAYLADRLGDAMNVRDYEGLRDFYEAHGYAGKEIQGIINESKSMASYMRDQMIKFSLRDLGYEDMWHDVIVGRARARGTSVSRRAWEHGIEIGGGYAVDLGGVYGSMRGRSGGSDPSGMGGRSHAPSAPSGPGSTGLYTGGLITGGLEVKKAFGGIPIVAHGKEAILNEKQFETMLEKMAGVAGGGGATYNFIFQPGSVFNGDDNDLEWLVNHMENKLYTRSQLEHRA